MPSLFAMVSASRIMSAASARVSGNWQISTRVACESAEIGLKLRLPQSLSQISARMSLVTGARKTRLDQELSQGLDPRAHGAVEFAETETVALDDLDHAGLGEDGRRIDHRADHMLRVEILRDEPARIGGFQMRSRRVPPPWPPEKYHHGMPFCMVTTMVSGPMRWCRSAAIGPT